MAKKTYLSQGKKDAITKVLIDRKFDPITAERDMLKTELGQAILDSQLSKEEWKIAERLPENWLPVVTSVRLKIPNDLYGTSDLKLMGGQRVPIRMHGKTYGSTDMLPELWAKWEALYEDGKREDGVKRTLTKEVQA